MKGKWDYLSLGEMLLFFFFRNFGCFDFCGALQYCFYLATNHKVSRNEVIAVWLCLWFFFFFFFFFGIGLSLLLLSFVINLPFLMNAFCGLVAFLVSALLIESIRWVCVHDCEFGSFCFY